MSELAVTSLTAATAICPEFGAKAEVADTLDVTRVTHQRDRLVARYPGLNPIH